MPLSFFVNNLHFAFEVAGAVAFLMAAWLTMDAYSVRKGMAELIRAFGLGLSSLSQVVHVLTTGSDVLGYLEFVLLLLGLVLVVGSFLKHEKFRVKAIIILPAFAPFSGSLYAAAAVLLLGIAFLSHQQGRREMNKTWNSFALAFLLLAAGAGCEAFTTGDTTSYFFIVGHLFEIVGFLFLVRWVWQYLELRIRESLVLIFISAALFLSTVVTLAFSTILISQIISETEASLLTDAKVLDLTVGGLKEEASVKAALIAEHGPLREALVKNDFPALSQLAEELMEKYKLGFLTITDREGSVVVRANALSRRGDSLVGERALEEALGGNQFVTIEQSPVEKLSIRAGAPLLEKGRVVGVIIAGYPLDNALLDRLKRVTGLDMFIYENDTPVGATALAEDGRTRLIGVPISNDEVKQVVLSEGKGITTRTVVGTEAFHASYLPLLSGDGKIVGMISAAKPEQNILDIANATNRLTLITVLLMLLLLTFPIYLFTKRLTEGA